ncbi:MAG: acyl-CoA dehydrogenase family protein [Dehalococcoidales bacterium]
MDFNLSEEQEMLKTSARDFLETRCPKSYVREMESDDRGYSPDIWREMAGLGWMGLAFPEGTGGSGMSFLELAVLLEEMGRACLPGPFFATVVLAGLTILDAGNEEQRQRYLPGIASGDKLATLALTETDGTLDAASIKMTAAVDSDDSGYRLYGTKLFVPDAHVADHILCVARTEEPADAAASVADDGLSLFVVDAGATGLGCSLLKTIAADKLCEVTFDGVPVPTGNLLGAAGKAWPVIERTLQRAAAARCCDLTGTVQRVLEMTLDYAKERHQFDRPIGSFQVIQHYCAQMATDVDATRFGAYQAAWALSEGISGGREVAIAKAWAGEAYERVVTLAHQIHGAIGCTIDHDLQFHTRRGKASQLSYGTGDHHLETVARQMGL